MNQQKFQIASAQISKIRSLVQELGQLLSPVTIGVVSRWCNDRTLAPFFLDHYSFADEIVILMGEDSTDDSEDFISRYPQAAVKRFKYKNGFNCREASEKVTKTVSQMKTDWVLAPDADEFIFPKGGKDIREVLDQADGNVIYADMWMMYRHRTEMDLDSTLKALWLRRHGDPNRAEGPNARYCKPIIVRSGLNIIWGVGLHNYLENSRVTVSSTRFDGAHWMMADPSIAIPRRLRGRRECVSKEDIANQWSCNNFDITEEEILEECNRHLDDPQLF